MAVNPTFTSTVRLTATRITTANTAHDGSGTIAPLITGAAAGTMIFEVVATAEVNTTPGMIRLWVTTNGGGNWRLYDELTVPQNTVSASSPGARANRTYTNLRLPDANAQLGATLENAQAHVIVVHGGDLT